MEPILAVSDLWVTFPAYRQESVRALKGISLRIDPGEFIADLRPARWLAHISVKQQRQ